MPWALIKEEERTHKTSPSNIQKPIFLSAYQNFQLKIKGILKPK